MPLVEALKRKLYDRMAADYFERKIPVLPYPPRELFVEPTNVCNLRCVMCPQSRGLKRPMGYMDLAMFERLCDEVKDFALHRLNLFMSGESTLNQQLPEMIAIARARKIYTRLHTNATVLSKAFSERLIRSGLDMISMSFEGEDKQRYEQLRIRAKYETTLARIRDFLEVKRDLKSVQPLVQVQVIKDFDPALLAPQVSETFKELFAGLPVDRYSAVWFHSFGELLGPDSQQKYATGPEYTHCRQIWHRFAITWDGKVDACCVDLDGELLMGDVRQQTVRELWNSPGMVRLRERLAHKAYQDISPCRGCNWLWQIPNGYKRPLWKQAAKSVLWHTARI